MNPLRSTIIQQYDRSDAVPAISRTPGRTTPRGHAPSLAARVPGLRTGPAHG